MKRYLKPREASKYSLSKVNNTYYLGYRDIPKILERYQLGNRAIDYGCGAGRSTRFLKELNFAVIGVDVCKKMIEEALKIDLENQYFLIESGKIPVLNNTQHLIFACFVLCTISTRKELLMVLQEIYRVLEKKGVFIVVTASDCFYSHEWVSYFTDYPENKQLKSGKKVKFYLKDLDVLLENYYWTDVDNQALFAEAGFKVLETVKPKGFDNEGVNWLSEKTLNPYLIYVLGK